jgi:hypothetical protein
VQKRPVFGDGSLEFSARGSAPGNLHGYQSKRVAATGVCMFVKTKDTPHAIYPRTDMHAMISLDLAEDNMPKSASCTHQRTQLIAKDDDAEYVECLDCGAIFETRELSTSPPMPAPSASGDPAQGDSGKPDTPDTLDESLSDA